MIKQTLTAVLFFAAPLAIYSADNVNLMPWVNGTEWSTTAVEKNSPSSYTIHVTDNWAGAGVDFAADHPDFQLDNFVGVHIDVTSSGGGNKMVYVNYAGGEYDEYGNQGQTGTYYFKEGKTVEKIVFKFANASTQTMSAFTLLAPFETTAATLAEGTWKMYDGDWGMTGHSIPASAFTGVKAGDVLAIYFNVTGNAQGQIFAPRVDIGSISDDNDTSKTCHLLTANGTYSDLYSGDSPIRITLNDDMAATMKARGLQLRGHDVTYTRFDLETSSVNNTVDVEEIPEHVPDPVVPADGLGGTPMGVAPKADLPRLFDNNSSTAFRATRADRAWAGLDLGEQYVIKKVKWMAADNDAWKTNLGIFEGANKEDFSDAIPIHIIRGAKGAGQWDEADVICSRGFRYVRYVGPRRLVDAEKDNGAGASEGSHAVMAELRFFGEKGAGDDSNLYRLSNLPTVVINTAGMEEPQDMYADPDKSHTIAATFSVISTDGAIVTASGETKERGNYSRTFPKRPIRMKYDKKNKPLPDAKSTKKKWELLNNYGDKTLMRNLVAFDISRKMGLTWTPYCTPVDLIINGEYRGCYQLADSKEVDKNRVNIHEMTLEEALAGGDALTGGYFLEIDAYADQEPAGTWFSSNGHYGMPVTVKAPKDDDVLLQPGGDAALKYIRDYFSDMENRVYNGTFDGDGSYRRVFDVESFLQLLMTNEVAGNKDVMWSFNMYKDLGDPHIYSGPAWDFDVAFDNSRYLSGQAYDSNTGDYLYHITESQANGFRSFTDKVMSDPLTKTELYHLWGAARDNGLTYEYLASQIDHYASLLSESQALNFERWPILDARVHDNATARGSYSAEVAHIKDFCSKIIPHFDNVIGYNANEHSKPVEADIEDITSHLRLSVPYGKLWVKDVAVADGEVPESARAASSESFVNSDKEWILPKTGLAENHLVTFYAQHAGRASEPQTILVRRDGTVSALDTVDATDGDTGTPAEFFSITGARVNPKETAPGVYIVRRGNKVSKIVLR